MSRSKKWLVLALALSALFSVPTYAVEKPIVKIGVIGPFSGDMAYIGQGVRNGINLALENLGPTKFEYQIIYEDNQLDAKKTALGVAKLINVDKIDTLVTIWSNTAAVAAPVATRSRVLHVSDSWEVKAADGKFNFGMYVAPEDQAKTFLAEAKKRDIKAIGILSIKSPGTTDLIADVKSGAPAVDIRVVADETFVSGQRDFRTILAKMREKKPEVYFLSAFSPEIELIAKQLREAGIRQPMTSAESFDETNDKSLFEGCWYSAPSQPPPPFTENYEKRFHVEMINDVPYVHDIIKLIAQGFESFPGTTKPSSVQVAGALAAMKSYHGINGDYHSDGHGYFHGRDTIKTIRNGKSVVVGE